MDDKKRIQNLLQENYSDLDILRDKPMVFKSGKYHIVIDAVRWLDHPRFIKQLAKIIVKHYELFNNLQFLSSYDYKDENVIKTLIEKVTLYTSSIAYNKLIKNIFKFIAEWGQAFIEKKEKLYPIKMKKKIFESYKIDEMIYMFFVLIVYNYDLVKKKTFRILDLFKIENKTRQTETSISGLKSMDSQMPKYNRNPYPKSILQLFEQQSKILVDKG